MELNKTTLLVLAKKAIIWLTMKRLVLMFMTSIAGISAYTVFENREFVADAFDQDLETVPKERVVTLSPKLTSYIDDTVNRSAKIAGAVVYITNIKVNQKQELYSYFDLGALTQYWSEYRKSHSDRSSVFDTNDQLNNVQMVSIVNGEFVCSRFEDTEYWKLAPGMEKLTPTVCRISIPAFYGNFSGTISFFITGNGSEHEIRLDAVRTSNEVYRELVLNRRAG